MNNRSPEPIVHDSVADLYDIYVRADFDVPFWVREASTVPGRTLELMCGTGRVSLPLLQAGVNLTCVDYAPEMLAQFRRKLAERQLSCPIFCQDIAELDLHDQFDLVLIPFHSFSEIIDPRRQKRALEQVHSHLAHHGTFICSLHNPTVRKASIDGMPHVIGDFPLPQGGVLKVSATMVFNPSTRIASGDQVYELFSSQQQFLARRTLAVNFYLFEHNEFEQLVKDCGFAVEAMYGDYDGHPFDEATSPFMLWKLRRSAAATTR